MTTPARPKLGKLANEFTSTFGLFEFAMKKCGHYDVNPRTGEIQTSWSKFAKANPQFDQAFFDKLKANKAANTVINAPPMKLREQGGKLVWTKPSDVTDMALLFRAVKHVRNNLFHGDKAEWNPSRDIPLIEAALEVLRLILAEAPKECAAFNDGEAIFRMQLS